MSSKSISHKTSASLGIVKKSQLIQSVSKRPCLWDHCCESFRSSTIRQAAFTDVAKEISDGSNQYTRNQIQEEWGKIRYCFTRIVKKVLNTDDDADAVSWPHWNEMQFMYDTIREHILASRSEDGTSFVKGPKISFSASSSYISHPAAKNGRKRKYQIHESDALGGCLTQKESTSSPATSVHSNDVKNEGGHCNGVTQLSHHSNINNVISDVGNCHNENDNNNWGSFVAQQLLSSANETLNSLAFPLNTSTQCAKSPEPSSPFAGAGGSSADFEARSGLPSVESNNDLDVKSTVQSSNKDAIDFFGKFMIRQIQSVSNKNPMLGVLLRKELMEVCCKYELQAFS